MKAAKNHHLKPKLQKMPVEGLVEFFCSLALEQDDAMLGGEQAKVNRLVWKLKDIADELKSREGDQRSALIRLYDHRNPQVRVNAIKATLAVAPEKARRALEVLANSKEFPAAGEAGMSIIALDRRGLRVTGRLNLAVARAREVLALMRERAVDGLSIGFKAGRSAIDRKTGIRRLYAVDLWEISVVTFPMLPQARITAVKDAGGEERRLLRALSEGARLMRQ
jgi:HK97 family phage prohead protease